ncbi:MAG: hypothetical protein ACOZBW_02175 [Thermodesulfobacteriota bacterium]
MLYCGRYKNVWVERALAYLPDDVFDKIEGKVAITVLNSDACRLGDKVKDKDEVIVLSPWIFSYIPPGSSEADKEWRYFIFAILHEIAHAVLKHFPPDELSPQESKSQEDEADAHALAWFNSHVLANTKIGLTPITIDEVRGTQAEYHKKLEPVLNHG